MFEKIILLVSIILLSIGIVAIFLGREFIRKKSSVDNENVVVRNIKLIGFVVIVSSLVTIYFCIN